MNNNYLIIGDDEYIKTSEVNKIKDKFLSPGETDLNYLISSPENTEEILDALQTMPFLADNRVVLVKAGDDFPESFIEMMTSYLENPFSSSIFVVTSAGSFKKNKKYKTLSKHFKIITADEPEKKDVARWIRAFFQKNNIDISLGAIELIVQLKGTNAQALKSELEKLLNFSNGERITEDNVESLVGRSVTESIFKLVDAINTRNAAWAFSILQGLYDEKKQPPEIIGYLGWYIRIMQKISLLSKRGSSSQEMAKEIGYSPAYVRRLEGQAKKYSIKKIEFWARSIFEADRDIKTGRQEAHLAVEMFLTKLVKK